MLEITEHPPVPGSVKFNERTMADLARWRRDGPTPSRGMFAFVGNLVAWELSRLGAAEPDMATIQNELEDQISAVVSAGEQEVFVGGFTSGTLR